LLDLSANRLNGIEPSSMEHLQSLVELNLSENSLTDIPSTAFDGLSKLRKLDLSYNQFSRIDLAMLADVRLLEVLILRNNRISEVGIDECETSRITAKKIDEAVELSVESTSLSKHDSLKHLDLGSNRIASLTDVALQGLGMLQYLNLSSNIVRFAA
uniref:CG12687 n=1 Tax=Toxocara canis TaxID=6265 RepID=A0A183U579_TOXCA